MLTYLRKQYDMDCLESHKSLSIMVSENMYPMQGWQVQGDPEGQKDFDFVWGIGHPTNNGAESLAAYPGHKLLIEHSITKATIIGDSLFNARTLMLRKEPSKPQVTQIVR